MTPRERMLNAYRGLPNDRPPVAPEVWTYYPARLLGVDLIEFERDVPFHLALKKAFEHLDCEGWGIVIPQVPNDRVRTEKQEHRLDDGTLETTHTLTTPVGPLTQRQVTSPTEPAWAVERLVKDWTRDGAAWEELVFGGQPEALDPAPIARALAEVGDRYLLEGWLGVPFFDFYAGAREGGFETAVCEFLDPEFEPILIRLRARYQEHLLRLVRALSVKTRLESFCLGCSWSCNSLIGPVLWRRWDKPVIHAVAEEVHRHGKLLHIHFHGKSRETLSDFAEIGVDCVCPFERPPGGDITGRAGLEEAARLLQGRTTMNGNVHTVETLLRGGPADVRREVDEVLDAFAGNPRVIVGTGDQVGGETPDENLHAMLAAVRARYPSAAG